MSQSAQVPYKVPLAVPGAESAGLPTYFSQGPFKGRTIRFIAAEIQKADTGRKFARKDKRPLDPPPVVQVRFFEVHNIGTADEYEREITDFDEPLGYICQVDLFPIFGENIVESYDTLDGSTGSTSQHPRPLAQGTTIELSPRVTKDCAVVAVYGNYPIPDYTVSTDILAGARVVTAVKLEHNGKTILAFPFNDLAVKQEGSYTLRYRIFNIFAHTLEAGSPSQTILVLASCFGGVFRVWSSKTFPGLAASTALTKRLSLHGSSVHVRTVERRGRKKHASGTQARASGSPQSRPSDETMDQDHAVSNVPPEQSFSADPNPNMKRVSAQSTRWGASSSHSGSGIRTRQ